MQHLLGLSISLALVLLLVPACGSSSGTLTPQVVVQGEQVIAVGQTAQLVAHTVNAPPEGYAWTSDDPDCAAVTEDGRITGMTPGQTLVHARGLDSGGESLMPITVVAQPDSGIPHYEEWKASAHGDENSPAFTIWLPLGEVPADCARCHSTHGYRDWIGDDGTAAGVVDVPPPTGTTVECVACHNQTTQDLQTVTFPSGETLGTTRSDALCMSCHGGRAAGADVDALSASIAPTTDDTPDPDLHFVSPHFLAAGATFMAGLAHGGYEYAGRSYDGRFAHASPYVGCTDCHDPHGLSVDFEACAGCHAGASDAVAVRGIRKMSSLTTDYDGDGDLDEGVADEIQGLLDLLMQAMQAYGTDVTGFPLARRSTPTPSYHDDANGDGIANAEETADGATYGHWTVRLLRAAYNYDHVANDAGAFAHNAKYAIQLLHDAIADLNSVLPTPVPLDPAARTDLGHFDGSTDAFRHWDDAGEVEAACARCHGGAPGFTAYLEDGANSLPEAPANGLACEVCHVSGASGALRTVDEVELPSGAVVGDAGNPSNLCLVCHAGRASKSTIDAAIAAADLSFQDVHQLPAAAVRFGADGAVGYEYAGRSYVGYFEHMAGLYEDCLDCHGADATQHRFEVEDLTDSCKACHTGANELEDIRLLSVEDYDGDGDADEGLRAELDGLAAGLYAALQAASAADGNPLIYAPTAWPYFFNDTDADGEIDAAEVTYANRFTAWTAALMKAAHNYQVRRMDPGAWAHNFRYVGQLLYDAMEDLGADVTAYVRPAGP